MAAANVGIHAAADTEYDWAWYGEMLGGAYFRSHPANQTATVNVEDATHPSTAHLPASWSRLDEPATWSWCRPNSTTGPASSGPP